MTANANTQAVLDFAKKHRCDPDWVARMIELGRVPVVLTPGQRGTANGGFDATVIGHFANGMYSVRVPGGPVCIPAEDFVPT